MRPGCRITFANGLAAYPIPLSLNQKKGSPKPWFRHTDTPPSIGPSHTTSPLQSTTVFSFEKTDVGSDRPSRRTEDHAFVHSTNGRTHSARSYTSSCIHDDTYARSLRREYGLRTGEASE